MEHFNADFPLLLAEHAPGATAMVISYLPIPLLRMLVKAADLAMANSFHNPLDAHATRQQLDGAAKVCIDLTYATSDLDRNRGLLTDRPSFLRLSRAKAVDRDGQLVDSGDFALAYDVIPDGSQEVMSATRDLYFVRPLLDVLQSSYAGWSCAGRSIHGASPVSFMELKISDNMPPVLQAREVSKENFIAGWFLHSPSAYQFGPHQRRALESAVDPALFKKYLVQLGTTDGEKIKEAIRTGKGWYELVESKVIAIDNRKSGINLGDAGAYVADLSLHPSDRQAMTYGIARLTLANHAEALSESSELIKAAVMRSYPQT